MTRRVLIFGTFDGFHDGHKFVISEASKKGSELIVAIARDSHVRELKLKEPKNNEQVRLQRIAQDVCVAQAVLSDEKLGTYQILDRIHPDVIVLGFDQHELEADLLRWMKEQGREISIETLTHFQNQ